MKNMRVPFHHLTYIYIYIYILHTYTVSRVTYTDEYRACIWTSVLYLLPNTKSFYKGLNIARSCNSQRHVTTYKRDGYCDAWTK